jgi:hypothetical protein
MKERIALDYLVPHCIIGSSVSECDVKRYLVCEEKSLRWITSKTLKKAVAQDEDRKKDEDGDDERSSEGEAEDAYKFRVCEKFSHRKVEIPISFEATIVDGPKSNRDGGEVGKNLKQWSWKIQWTETGQMERIDTALAIAGIQQFKNLVENAEDSDDNDELNGGITDADTSFEGSTDADTTFQGPTVTPIFNRSNASTAGASTNVDVPSITQADANFSQPSTGLPSSQYSITNFFQPLPVLGHKRLNDNKQQKITKKTRTTTKP